MASPLPSCLYSGNATFIEALYEDYLANPSSVSDEWRAYFDQLQTEVGSQNRDRPHSGIIKAFEEQAKQRKGGASSSDDATIQNIEKKQVSVLQLINSYRFRGHRRADLDPLRQYARPDVPELDLDYHGLSESDLDTKFNAGSMPGEGQRSLREILDIVQTTYCQSIGAEYMHINETAQKRWIQERLETGNGIGVLSDEHKKNLLNHVIAATSLEEYLHNRYVGQKRFSLEGGESLIPMLDEIIQYGGESTIRECVIAMAHRGRLNVLVNIIGKQPGDLFGEFEGKNVSDSAGDVKYHLGYSSDISTAGGPVHLTLAFNPSHLEIISPVAEGSVRARQDRRHDNRHNEVLPIIIHGDAAFAGQGVVMETFNLSQTRGYSTGGTLHIVINNQIGFTTSDPLDSRSTLYCTDVAKMIQAPIFHVNGDDPEAVAFVARLAMEYRMTFNKDVVIDMVCYRKHGHSEADEPFATQPVMYNHVKKHPGVKALYTQQLVDSRVVTAPEAQSMQTRYISSLDNNEVVSRPLVCNVNNPHAIDFSHVLGTNWTTPGDTRITRAKIEELTARIVDVPSDFKLHRSVKKLLAQRKQMGADELAMDWGYAETMAYASLVDEGYPVRLSGQDCGRGTFFHRHAVLHDQENGETFLPLQHIQEGQANFLVINSTLSEEAVLAFEYGYSSSSPDDLVIWEAQFGDFANGAQVVIDQFIASCEAKWGRHCGLVVMLPHGYDGQGPEHSSARLERYLQLCADENMQVCYPSVPSQMFHMLRRQIQRPYRRPLIIMSPKSLLRHKLSVSSVSDLTDRGFQNTFGEIDDIKPNKVKRILICSGKVYFDLLEARRENKIDDIAILRLEQLYPFPKEEVEELIGQYSKATEIVWVQEEPRNQGSWIYLLARNHLMGCLNDKQDLLLVGRPYSASPAVGYMSKHLEQQKMLITEALQLEGATVSPEKEFPPRKRSKKK